MTEPSTEREFTARSSQRNVRAIILPVAKKVVEAQKAADPGKSKELPEDPLQRLMDAGDIIEPPFDILTLSMLNEHSTELNQCLEAMETNIDGFGHRLISRVKTNATARKQAEKDLVESVAKEKTRLENFFAYAAGTDSFVAFRRKLRKDIEATGIAGFEVIRNAAGDIQAFNHIPSYQIRLSRIESDAVKVKMPMLWLNEDGSISVKKVYVWKRFRKFVQARYIQRRNLSFTGSMGVRWFKEFGDPRVYDYETGECLTDVDKKWLNGKKAIPEEKQANEFFYLSLYSPRTPYGLPRYIGNLLSIFGDRASEEINYITFQNNNIPSMLLLVSNGQLTQASIDRIRDFVEAQIQGSDNYSKFLLLEAEGDLEGEDQGQVKIEVKPLTGEQHKDALFQQYSKNNQDKVRRAFRLPPIFVGRSDDYSRATAESSRRLADEQIFAPERDEFDSIINRRIFPDMGIIYHRFKSNSPNTTDNTELVKILAGAEKTGGMTPRIARLMLEDILGIELPGFPKDFDPDQPFSLVMAEAVKNQADATEPGQQVTALKTMELIEKLTGASGLLSEDAKDEEIAQRMLRLRDRLESSWRLQAGFTEG